MTPHGIVRRLVRGQNENDSQGQSQRQQELFRDFVPIGSVVFDIGANLGNRIDALLDCGARVIAVEPQPDCVARLRSAYRDRVTIIQAAVGDVAGRLPLRISAPFDCVASLSGEFISRAQGTHRFGRREWKKTIDVDVITLDSLVSKFGLPSFIKIDAEGYEYEVLCGLSKGVDVISFEWASDSPKTATQCLEHLVGLGLPFFQFSFGESMVFAHQSSLDLAKAKQLIASLGEEHTLFGDIYASRRPLLRAG